MPSKNKVSIVQRFDGRGGKKRLIEALLRQFIVAGNRDIAARLARHVVLQEFKSGKRFLTEGASDNDIYFLLTGVVSIRVNGREVAQRRQGDHVGEMALLDTTALRSASVITLERTVTARISEPVFTQIANRFPEVWRRVALALSQRLKERSKFHQAPRSEPVIFIGSSTEGLPVACIIRDYFEKLPCVPKLWAEDVFQCSKTAIEDLTDTAAECDFSVLIFTSDDVTRSRGKQKSSPRDNVIFELGLFMGALGRERTYIVASKAADIKIPSDLLGVTQFRFEKHRGQTLNRSLRGALQGLRKLIETRGPI